MTQREEFYSKFVTRSGYEGWLPSSLLNLRPIPVIRLSGGGVKPRILIRDDLEDEELST